MRLSCPSPLLQPPLCGRPSLMGEGSTSIQDSSAGSIPSSSPCLPQRQVSQCLGRGERVRICLPPAGLVRERVSCRVGSVCESRHRLAAGRSRRQLPVLGEVPGELPTGGESRPPHARTHIHHTRTHRCSLLCSRQKLKQASRYFSGAVLV